MSDTPGDDERKWRTEMEEAFEDLASRQDETDVSVTKVLDIVQRIERNQRQLMQAQGIEPV